MPKVITPSKLRKRKETKRTKEEKRHELIDKIMGKYSWVPYSVDDFLRDKRREIALEDRA